MLFCVWTFPLFAVTGCGKQLARMEENQTRLQAMIAANTRDLATISDQLHTGQGKIHDSLQTLDADTQQVAAAVGTVQQEQRQFRAAVAAGHEGLHNRIAKVQDSQQTLQGGVTGVAEVTQRTAADLTALAREHGTLHAVVQANQQELTGRLGAVTNNQQRIQTGLGDLRQASTGLARDIASVAAKHDTLYATVQDNDRRLAERLTALADGTERVCANITHVDTLLQRMATDLAAGHTALQEQLGASRDGLATQIAALATQQQTLQAGVDTLDGKADRTAADLADTRSSLQDTLRVSREVLTGQMAASLQNQQTLHSNVQGLHDKADKMTEDIGEVAAGQTALHQTVQANHDVVLTAMAGLTDGQDTLRSSLTRLDGKADRTSGDLTALAQGQQSLYESVQANHDAVAAGLTGLAEGQTVLRDNVSTLDGKTEALAAAQNAFQQTLLSHRQAVNDGVAQLAQGQQTLRAQMESLAALATRTADSLAGVGDQQATLQQTLQNAAEMLSEKMNRTAAGLSQLGQQQAALQESLRTGHLALTARATELADHQKALQNGIDGLAQATQRVSANCAAITAAQDVLHQTLTTRSNQATEQMKVVADLQEQMKGNLEALTAVAGQAALDILALSNGQTGLTKTVTAGVTDLGTRTDKVAAELTAVAAGQNSLQEALARQGQTASGQMARLTEGQQQIQSGLDTLTATTGQASLDILAVQDGQAGLAQAVQTGVADLSQQTKEITTGLVAVAAAQNSLQDSLNRHGQAVSGQMAQVVEGQRQTHSGLETLTATTGQASLDILAVREGQAGLTQAVQTGVADLSRQTKEVTTGLATVADAQNKLQDSLQRHGQNVASQMAQVVEGQRQTHSGLDTLTATTGQASLDILAVRDGQADLTQAVQTGAADLSTRTKEIAAGLGAVAAAQSTLQDSLQRHGQNVSHQMAQVVEGQRQTHSGLETLTATTGQTALDILGVAERQEALKAAVQTQYETSATHLAALANQQEQMHSDLDTLTATAGQTALDVIAMTTRQEAIQAAVQGQGAALDARTAALANGQQQIQSDLEVVTATTGQASLDTLALGKSQGQLAQAVQAGRQETAGLLTALSQGQQNGAARLEAAQAQVATVTASIAALERQVASLQGLLQAGLQGTATLLGTTDQQRQQFETRVGHDLQAVIDSLAQLRQTQASLQDQIAQVQKSTQGQADNLRSVIEQIKATSNAGGRAPEPLPEVNDFTEESESRQPPADIRVGAAGEDAAVPEIAETPVAAK